MASETTTLRRMMPVAGAKIVNVGHVDFNALDQAALQQLTYGTAPIGGNDDSSNMLTNGDVFAVLTNAGNFAKVQVVTYGYDMHVRYATYKVGPAYRVLGTGYTEPEDIVVDTDGRHAFVTERIGNVLRVDLAAANRVSATVLASGLNAPHQMQFNAAHNALYVVEFFSPGRLLQIDVLTGTVTTITNQLDHAIGLEISADRAHAYVCEQSAGGGRVRRVTLSTGAIADSAAGLSNPFMMTWLDETKERLILTERDPANRLAVIDLSQGNTITRPISGTPLRPSSVAMLPSGDALVCCDSVIAEYELGTAIGTLTGSLFKDIGNVPFDRILSGLADTTGDPTYFYQVKNAPFGGVLPLRVNHMGAWLDGARWYRVLLDGMPRTDSWTDYKWNSVSNQYDAVTVSPQSAVGLTNVYPIHDPTEVFLWFNIDLGSRLDTHLQPDGIHTLQIQFFSMLGGLVTTTSPLQLLLENASCIATMAQPHIGLQFASPNCGVLDYNAADTVQFDDSANHPHGFATYSFSVQRGANAASIVQSGPVTGPMTVSAGEAALLGGCTIAGFTEILYVAASAINGEYRQSQYDAEVVHAFVLAPA
ncbi:MAG: hypothetical protein ABR591_15580 [Candidatus Velthaea sp.]